MSSEGCCVSEGAMSWSAEVTMDNVSCAVVCKADVRSDIGLRRA